MLKSPLDTIDEMIRSGQVDSARDQLNQLASQARELGADYAALCRRAELPELGLTVFSGKHEFTDSEKVEFCFCLKEAGASDEARQRVYPLLKKKTPKAHLCAIHLAFNDWDFHEVIDVAKDYLQSHELKDYEAAIVSVNLAAALTALERREEAQECLYKTLAACSLNDWQRLRANCHEIQGQLEVQSENWDEAAKNLEKCRQLLAVETSRDIDFVERWKAVIKARREQSRTPLEEFQKKIQKTRNLELFRAIDFEILKVEFDPNLFNKLFFGSPFPNYRQLLEELWGKPDDTWALNPQGSLIFDTHDGTLDDSVILKPGTKPHAAIAVLLQDFYRPVKVGTFFRYLFPGEDIEGESSFHRVHQSVYRTRDLLKKKNVPMDILSENGIYHLNIDRQLCVRLHLKNLISRWEGTLYKVQRVFGKKIFTAKQATEKTGLSSASISRFLKFAEQKSWINKAPGGYLCSQDVRDL